jgi:dolichyl-diphosphooligosaccharide--protein glycosyltransferase
MISVRTPWLLIAIALLAVTLRSLDYPRVFPEEGPVALRGSDSSYQARRALYTFANFPEVLSFDPFIAYPDGARVPMPPLYGWALGGTARLFGSDEASFERVVAWSTPLLAALIVWPVFSVGRALGGTGLGLGAALLYAALPAGARRSALGDVDHHAAAALLGAVLLASSLRIVRCGSAGRLDRPAIAVSALTRAALVLTWSGSLLYLTIAEAALLLVACVEARRELLRAQFAGALGGGALVLPWLLLRDAAGAPPFSTTDVSWAQPLALGGIAAVCGGLAWFGERFTGLSLGGRVFGAALAGLAVGGLFTLAIPELRAELGSALAFLAKQDLWAPGNLEQRPIFRWLAPEMHGRLSGRPPLARITYGWLAYAIPLAIGAIFWRARAPERRPAALCAGLWASILGTLAVLQVRYALDFAPVVSVGFALLLAAVCGGTLRRLGAPGWLSPPMAVALGALLLGPALEDWYGPPARRLWEAPEKSRLGSHRTLALFGRMIRSATPETGGFLGGGDPPAYAILSNPSFGHTLLYNARRPVVANNFGPYLDRAKYVAAVNFYQVRDERAALQLARHLRTRYAVTHAHQYTDPARFSDRLHGWDGRGPAGHASARRWRLIVEGPENGSPIFTSFPSGRFPLRSVPYKLFEQVPGAVLEVRAPPGATVRAEVAVTTNLGRGFTWFTEQQLDAGGVARIRVPYATEPAHRVRAKAPYLVRAGDRSARLRVPERAVLRGSVLPLTLTSSPHPGGASSSR